MMFSGKIWPSFDSYGNSYVKKWPKSFLTWISKSNMTQNVQKLGLFRSFMPKIDPKMVLYKITFTKKWFFITTFHLFTQIRIILDHQIWDHFYNERNLNKQIWVFWAPVLEKKSNRVPKNIVFPYGFNEWFLITICYLWMLYSRGKKYTPPLISWFAFWSVQPKVLKLG